MKPFPWHEEPLRRVARDRARLPHALLIHGPRGIGKARFAQALAASVLCETPRDGLACGACDSCRWFEQGNHPDYREIVPEASAEDDAEVSEGEGARAEKGKSLVIKIEQIRAIADFISLSTHRAGYRVLLIHPAEALHPAAANALLKTLEEPPAATLIMLVSDQPARVLPTLRSRCRALPLAMPPRDEALAWLRAEGVSDAQVALDAAGGAPLFARDLAEPEETDLRRRVLAELARPGGAHASLAATIDRAAVERFIYWLQTWTQDLVHRRIAGSVRHHRDFAAALEARARGASLERLFDLDRELAAARAVASHPLNPRLLAEHLLLAYNRATSDR
ncbi:MAG: DNA polymerase III subunit delta' [Bacillota bacterium]